MQVSEGQEAELGSARHHWATQQREVTTSFACGRQTVDEQVVPDCPCALTGHLAALLSTGPSPAVTQMPPSPYAEAHTVL